MLAADGADGGSCLTSTSRRVCRDEGRAGRRGLELGNPSRWGIQCHAMLDRHLTVRKMRDRRKETGSLLWEVWSERRLWPFLQPNPRLYLPTRRCPAPPGGRSGIREPLSALAPGWPRSSVEEHCSVRPMPKRSRRFGAAASLRAGNLSRPGL